MNKTDKHLRENLDAANKEVRQVMDENKRLREQVTRLDSDKQMLMWQMDIVRTTLSRVVQP